MSDSARSACRDFVRASLHDSVSARFEPTNTYPVKRGENGVYRVLVRVRARNAFNALRMETIECHIRRERGKWVGAAPLPLAFPSAQDEQQQRERMEQSALSQKRLEDGQAAARARIEARTEEIRRRRLDLQQ